MCVCVCVSAASECSGLAVIGSRVLPVILLFLLLDSYTGVCLLICSSNWCGLCLCLFSLLGLEGRAGLGEGVQVHGVVRWSVSWRDRV